jgi:hypothetical protein
MISQVVNKKLNVGFQKLQISTADLTGGVYFIKLQSENKISQIKMIVIH